MKSFIDTYLDKIQGNRSSHVTVPFVFYLISDCFFKILNKIITVSAKLTAWSSHTNLSASPFRLPILIPYSALSILIDLRSSDSASKTCIGFTSLATPSPTTNGINVPLQCPSGPECITILDFYKGM